MPDRQTVEASERISQHGYEDRAGYGFVAQQCGVQHVEERLNAPYRPTGNGYLTAEADITVSTSQAMTARPIAPPCRRVLIRAAALSPAAVAIPLKAAISQPRPRQVPWLS